MTIPMMRGTMLCTLPQTYWIALVSMVRQVYKGNLLAKRPIEDPS
jgi:hypothetical protein